MAPDRYPDWLRRDGEPQNALAAFDMLVGIAGGIRSGQRQLALWSLQSEAAGRYARRLHDDERLRAQAAIAVGTTLEVFDERAPEILSTAHGIGHFPRLADTANILRTGNFRG